MSSGSQHLQAQGDMFAMKNLYASRILDFDRNGLVIKAFKNLSLVAESERRFSSAMFISENYNNYLWVFSWNQRSFWPGAQSVTFNIVSRCFENKNNNFCETNISKNAICLLITNP